MMIVMIDIDISPTLPLPALLSELSRADLAPSPRTNHLFSELVKLSMGSVEATEQQRKLAREIASAGESQLEMHWAQRIMEGYSIEAFPYVQNYMMLVEHEYGELMKHAEQSAAWAFVGSGPLPLSQILFERLHGGQHAYIENDPDAHHLGAFVASALGSPGVSRAHELIDAINHDYADYDIVLVAALVGKDDAEKRLVLEWIVDSARPGTIIAARSVPDDGRTLLYPRLASCPAGVTFLAETDPPKGVINSLVVMRVDE